MSGKSRYVTSADGLPARVSGHWASTKLRVLSDYMTLVNRAMVNKWPSRSFIDLMAGGGQCAIVGHDDRILSEFEGSPRRAAATTPPFTSLIFVEQVPSLLHALRQRVGEDTRTAIIEGNCNAPDVIDHIRRTVPRGLGIVFADNLGLDVTFDSLRRLTADRRWDVVVTFQVSALRRTKHLAVDEPDRWDAFFGTNDWLQVMRDFEARRLRVRELPTALLELYSRQMASIGYSHHRSLPDALRNSRGGKLYTLELYSKHPLAGKLFEAVSPRDSQFRLQLD